MIYMMQNWAAEGWDFEVKLMGWFYKDDKAFVDAVNLLYTRYYASRDKFILKT